MTGAASTASLGRPDTEERKPGNEKEEKNKLADVHSHTEETGKGGGGGGGGGGVEEGKGGWKRGWGGGGVKGGFCEAFQARRKVIYSLAE